MTPPLLWNFCCCSSCILYYNNGISYYIIYLYTVVFFSPPRPRVSRLNERFSAIMKSRLLTFIIKWRRLYAMIGKTFGFLLNEQQLRVEKKQMLLNTSLSLSAFSPPFSAAVRVRRLIYINIIYIHTHTGCIRTALHCTLNYTALLYTTLSEGEASGKRFTDD